MIGGTPLGMTGNRFTLNHFRTDPFSLVNQATIGSNDIISTRFPNVYRIYNPNSRFVLERGDSVSISYDRSQDTEQFRLSHIDFEDPELLWNAQVSRNNGGYVTNLPLLSIEMAGS